MKQKIAIYLAGSIKKGHERADETYWTEKEMSLIKSALRRFEVLFLNPAFRMDDLSDEISVFGRDMLQVFSSHVVFVDARDRRGLGVGAEMMWAKANKIPVVTWSPKNSHYNKEHTTLLDVPVKDFIHPFVAALSDKIVEDPMEGAMWIEETLSTPERKIKGLEFIGEAMNHYRKSQFPVDLPMKELLTSSEELRKRMERSHPQVLIEK